MWTSSTGTGRGRACLARGEWKPLSPDHASRPRARAGFRSTHREQALVVPAPGGDRMSEYQFYEFRAVDRPLTPEETASLRKLSSRAEITPTRLEVTYNYGDFRGNPHELMKQYFDAHVYVSNFGFLTFMLRLPRAA